MKPIFALSLAALVTMGCRSRPVDDEVRRDPVATPDAAPPEPLRHVWSKVFTGGGDRLPRDLAGDRAGNLTIVGRFSNTVDWGNGPVVSSGGTDAFVVSLDAAGGVRFARGLGGSGYDEAFAVAMHDDGSVRIGGGLVGSADFGTGSIGTGVESAPFLATLGPDGKTRDARVLSGRGEVRGLVAAADTFVAGRDLVAKACKLQSQVIAARVGPAGEVRWTTCLEDHGFGGAERIALAPNGDVVVCGTFRANLILGGKTIVMQDKEFMYVASSPELPFVARLAGDTGAPIWVKAGLAKESVKSLGLAVAPDGSIALGGQFFGDLDFAGQKFAATRYGDGFVVELGPDGAPRFGLAFADPNEADAVAGLAYSEGWLVAGKAGPGVKIGSATAKAAGAFVARIARTGEVSWARRFRGGSPIGLVRGAGIGLAGDLFTSAGTATAIDLGGGPLTGAPLDGGTRFETFVANFNGP